MPLTQEQFNSLRSKGLSVDQIVGFESGGSPAPTLGDEFQERAGKLESAIERQSLGQQGLGRTTATAVGETLGFGFDIIGKGVSKLDEATPEWLKNLPRALTPDFIERAVEGGVANLSKKASDKMAELNKDNPRAAQDLRNAGNILGFLAFASGTKKVQAGAAEGGKIIKDSFKRAGTGIGERTAIIGERAASVGPQIAEKAGSAAKYLTKEATGLSVDTIELITKNPAAFEAAKRAGLERGTLGNVVKDAIDVRLGSISGLGKEYNLIRNSTDVVKLPQGGLIKTLNKYDVALDIDGKIVLNPESIALTSTDVKALQEFIERFGAADELSAKAFLNARKSLSNMAAFETGKSDAINVVAKGLRKYYDDLGKNQIAGLRKLDTKFAGEITELNRIKKEYINRLTGELKDNALNKIANAGGVGKNEVLKRLETIVPGITEKINILKALEDVQYTTKNFKVGTYLKGGAIGFGVSGGNPLGAVMGGIISNPEFAVPIIQAFAKFKGMQGGFLERIINTLKSGGKLSAEENKFVGEAIVKYSENIGKKAESVIPQTTLLNESQLIDIWNQANK